MARVAARQGPDALVGEDVCQELLDILVVATADDWNDDFDLDSDFAMGIDACFHTRTLQHSGQVGK